MGTMKIEMILFGAFLVVGLGLLGGAWYIGYRQYTVLKTWPSLEAVVLDSELYRHRKDFVRKSGRTVVFGYSANGKEYKSLVSSPIVSRSYKAEQEFAEKYAPGSRHSIRYNPQNPNDIRFEAGYGIRFFFWPVLLGFLGVVFSMLGLVGLFVFRNR